MTEVAGWLLVVGVCDLLRAARDVTTPSRRLLMAGLGTALMLLHVLALDLSVGRAVLLLAGGLVTFWAWLVGSSLALDRGGAGARTVAFAGLAAGIAGSLLAGGQGRPWPVEVPGPLGSVGGPDLLLGGAVLLAQTSTANIAVRLLLDAVGVPASTNEKQLKGGRLIGPMERLFLVGLGAAGELTAAAVVVAAKSLLRFPDLQRGSRTGPSDLSEYFLIGSLASWLVALGGVALLVLGR